MAGHRSGNGSTRILCFKNENQTRNDQWLRNSAWGICYSLADSALAFASNGHGQHSVSIETSISHVKAVRPGDELRAEANEVATGRKTGQYEVKIYNQKEELVAWFKGTIYKKKRHGSESYTRLRSHYGGWSRF